MNIDISKAHDSIIVRNHANDPSYAPYCMRCDGLRRMRVIEPFLFQHHCGAVHDERQVITKGEPCPDCGDTGITQDGPHNVFCACPAGRRIASVWASMPTKGEGVAGG